MFICDFVNFEVWKFHADANERLLLVIKQNATDDLIQRKPTIYTHTRVEHSKY